MARRSLALPVIVASLALVAACGSGGSSPAADLAPVDAVADATPDVAADPGEPPADVREDPGADLAADVPPDAPADGADVADPGDDPGADVAPDTAPDAPGDVDPDAPADVPPADVDPDAPPYEPKVVWGKCNTAHFSPGYPPPDAAVKCGTIEVPVDPSQPAGARMKLQVGRQQAVHPSGRAVFFVQGGPGGDSLELSVATPYFFQDLNQTVDYVYVDQRGTGGSDYLDCKGGYPDTPAEWKACATLLAGKPLDHYLTTDAAHDLDLVRRALGYERISIWGGSYGTRVGLEYLRQHGDRAEAVVLDGVAPPDMDYAASMITATDKGVQLLVQDCEADPACKAVSPTLAADLKARKAALEKEPHAIRVGGMPYVEDAGLYVQALSAALMYWESRFLVPRAIHASVQGDNGPWNEILGSLFGTWVSDDDSRDRSAAPLRLPLRPRWASGDVGVSPGLFMTVFCAEFFPNNGGMASLEALLAEQEWAEPGVLELLGVCASWPVQPIDAALRQPVVSDGKVLLMNGAIDLQTFAEWGAGAAATLANGTNLVVPYMTHGVVQDACAASIEEAFLLAAGAGAVDASCLQAIPKPAW